MSTILVRFGYNAADKTPIFIAKERKQACDFIQFRIIFCLSSKVFDVAYAQCEEWFFYVVLLNVNPSHPQDKDNDKNTNFRSHIIFCYM